MKKSPKELEIERVDKTIEAIHSTQDRHTQQSVEIARRMQREHARRVIDFARSNGLLPSQNL